MNNLTLFFQGFGRITWICITYFANGVFWILTSIFEAIENGLNSSIPKKEGFDADFLSQGELLSSFNKGFTVTGAKSLTEKDSHQHVLVIGGSGSGKSTVVIIPSIFSLAKHGHSQCIHDPSGELYNATAGYLRSLEYDVLVLDYNRPEMSDGYNPLERIKTGSDIFKTATTLVQNSMGKSGTDAFWNSQAVSFISLMITILKKQSAKYQTLTNVRHLVNSFLSEPEMMDRLVAGCCDPAILKEYKSFLTTEKKVMANVISTCRSSLQLFADESIQLVTSEDSINFNKFREKKTALFIMNKTADLSYYAPLSSTFFLQFFNFIMSQPVPDKKTRSIFFLIDEMSSLFLPTTMQIALSNLRKYRCGIMGIIQDCNQLEHLYGKNEAGAILSNCYCKVYFPGQPIDTARELESMLGKREYEDDDGKKRTRALLTADEIRVIDKEHALIFCGPNRAIYAYMKPFYKNYRYNGHAKLPIANMNRNILQTNVHLIGS
ncbi:MAG: type IV secretory system conjugative DNA transfer family protein [Bacteroidota bacterium]|nr:type IV secretory system conjugative DNA transfer family protein [Bacteroidota bacterium]